VLVQTTNKIYATKFNHTIFTKGTISSKEEAHFLCVTIKARCFLCIKVPLPKENYYEFMPDSGSSARWSIKITYYLKGRHYL